MKIRIKKFLEECRKVEKIIEDCRSNEKNMEAKRTEMQMEQGKVSPFSDQNEHKIFGRFRFNLLLSIVIIPIYSTFFPYFFFNYPDYFQNVF